MELRGPKDLIQNITAADVTVIMDFEGEEPGHVSKMPKVVISDSFAGVGAITVPAIAATVQTLQTAEAMNAAVG